MTSTRVYALNGKSTNALRAFSNGWGSAPVLWDYLSEKYLGLKAMPFGENERQKLWDLARDKRLTGEERACHMLTFDRAYVPLQHLERVSDACYSVYADMPAKYKGDRVNHWYGLGALFSQLAQMKFHHRCRGVCIAPTSVEDHWRNPDPDWARRAWSIFKEQTA
jgi:hypothetical protein